MTGSVPATLGLAGKLQTIDFAGNQLSGSIPHNLGTPQGLRFVYLGFNKLTGERHLLTLCCRQQRQLRSGSSEGSRAAAAVAAAATAEAGICQVADLNSQGVFALAERCVVKPWLTMTQYLLWLVLAGSIPSSLALHDALEALDLRDNQLTQVQKL